MADLNLSGLDFSGPAKPIMPDPIEMQSKLAQLQTYNLDAATKARNFGALRDYGQAAASGNQAAKEALAAKFPEAASVLAGIEHTTAATTHQKFETQKQKRAALAQELSQMSDPAQKMAFGLNRLNEMEKNKEIHPQMAQDFRKQLETDPRVLDGWMYQNLPTTEVPAIQARRLEQSTGIGLKGKEVEESWKPEVSRPEFDPKTGTWKPRLYPPTQLPHSIRPEQMFSPSAPMTTPPTAPYGAPGPSSRGPGEVRRMSFIPEPSTYIPGGSAGLPNITAPNEYKGLIASAASKYGVPEELLTRVLHAESGFNPNAVGPMTKYGTAKGIAQFIPSTAAERGVNPTDPNSAIPGAASYLADLYKKTGSWQGALRGYLGTTPNPSRHPSYFRSGAAQLSQQLDSGGGSSTRGAAPPAPAGTTVPANPGSTSTATPGSTVTAPPPNTSMMPSTEPAPELPSGSTETSTTDESGVTTNVRETPLGTPSARGIAPAPSSTGEPASRVVEPLEAAETEGETGPAPITPSAGGDTDTVVKSRYDTGSPHPSATVVPAEARTADNRPGRWGPTEAELKAQEKAVLDPLVIEQEKRQLEVDRIKADIEFEKQQRALSLDERKQGMAAAIGGAQRGYDDVEKQAQGATKGEEMVPVIENAMRQFRTGNTAELRKTVYDLVTDFAGALGIQATEAQKQSAYAAAIKSGGALLAFDLVNALGAREAVQVVQQVMSIKPGLLNSPGANKIILEAIKMDFQRRKDMRDFYDDWMTSDKNKHPNTYIGAAKEFARLHPVGMYASKVVPFPLPTTDDHKIDTSKLRHGIIYDVGDVMRKKGSDEKAPKGSQWKWDAEKGWQDAGKAIEYR